jgi:hypothetical protein
LSSSNNDINLSLYFKERAIPRFFQILQKGFIMKTRVGCNITDLFCQQFGLSPQYFEDRVQTIFLDGNPVDDAHSAIVKDGSHIALSGAMPGLVGAVLRKGGFYSSMRSEISYRENSKTESTKEGVVFLKIFNLLLKDLGPAFLAKGIWIEGKEIQTFLKKRSQDFWREFRSAKMDGEDQQPEELLTMKWSDRMIFLQVQARH